MSNPFYSDSEDDDILKENPAANDPSVKGNSDGYMLHGIAGKELPDSLKDKMQTVLGVGGPTVVGSTKTPETLLLMAQMMTYLSRLNFANEPNALVLALADVVNEQTDGRLEKFATYRLAEKKILVAHEIKKFCNKIITMNDIPDMEYWSEFLTYMEILLSLQEFTIDNYAGIYRDLSEELSLEIDETLINSGIKSSRTLYEKMGLRPKAEQEA